MKIIEFLIFIVLCNIGVYFAFSFVFWSFEFYNFFPVELSRLFFAIIEIIIISWYIIEEV